MTMENFSENLSAHPFPKLDRPLLAAGRVEMAALAGEWQKTFALLIHNPFVPPW
jgi:hypothetical protein